MLVAILALGVFIAHQAFRPDDEYTDYRFAAVPAHTPTATPLPANWQRTETWSVPILMYHYIRPLPTGDPLGRGLSVSPEAFGRQLDQIAAAGYTPITFAQLQEEILPPKPVILTFDDGTADAYTVAFPALRERRMTGVFYVVSGFVDQPGSVTWDQLREMQDAGMEIGAHSVSHPDLATSAPAERQRQVEGSVTAIEEALGQPVITFAYPAGKSNAETVRLVKDAGIRFAVTTVPGTAANTDNPLLLPRYRAVDTSDLRTWLR